MSDRIDFVTHKVHRVKDEVVRFATNHKGSILLVAGLILMNTTLHVVLKTVQVWSEEN